MWSLEFRNLGVWSLEAWSQESVVWCLTLDSGIWSLESGVWKLECGIWSLESTSLGRWNLESRIRSQELGSLESRL